MLARGCPVRSHASLCARSHPRPGLDGPSYLGLTSFFLGRDANGHDVQRVFNMGDKHAGLRQRQEIVPETQLQPMVVEMLRRFHEVNGVPPRRVLFYRDGVGDSQFGDVMRHEVPYTPLHARLQPLHQQHFLCHLRLAGVPPKPPSRAAPYVT